MLPGAAQGNDKRGRTKVRAQRIVVDYFRRPDRARSRRWLLIGISLLVLGAAIGAIFHFGHEDFVHSAPPHHYDTVGFVAGGVNPHDPVQAKDLHQAWVRFDQEGCRACHQPLKSIEVASCAECHADLAGRAHHPFGRWTADEVSGGAHGGCALCHGEHGSPLMASDSSLATCAYCHGSEIPKAKALSARMIALPSGSVSLVAKSDFPHDVHHQQKCDDCHQLNAAGELGDLLLSDFVQIPFSSCQSCHETAGAEWAEDRDPPPLATWHPITSWSDPQSESGAANGQCRQCHIAGTSENPTPRDLIEDLVAPRRFTVDRLAHRHLDSVVINGRACIDCHRRGLDARVGQALPGQRAFAHEQHVADLANAPRESCLVCHQQITDPAREPGRSPHVNLGAAPAACATCHAEVRAPTPSASLVVEVAPDESAPARVFTRFPHEIKGHLEYSCNECHFQAAPADPAAPRWLATAADAHDCSRCHGREHKNIAGNGCHRCHAPGEEDEIFPMITRWSRASDPNFNHQSRGHKNLDCAKCHDQDATMSARSLSAVPLPSESTTASCRECHVLAGTRFHFR